MTKSKKDKAAEAEKKAAGNQEGFSQTETERTLKHKFTKEELEELQKRIAREYANLNLIESEKSGVMAQYGSKIKQLKALLVGLASSINQGYTHLPMKCTTQYSWKEGVKRTIHPETGEVVEESKIMESERQMSLKVTK